MSNEKISTETWVVEWSEHQKKFHVATVSESVVNNLRMFKDGSPENYWVPLMYCDTNEEAHAWCDKFREMRPELKR